MHHQLYVDSILDSSCGPWTVLHLGCCLHCLLLPNYYHGSVPLHIHTRNPHLCQNPSTPHSCTGKFILTMPKHLNVSCHLSGPGGYWPNPMGLGFKENLFNPCSNGNPSNSRDSTKVPSGHSRLKEGWQIRWVLYTHPPFTQSSSFLICLTCLPFPNMILLKVVVPFFLFPVHCLNFFV